MASSIQLRRAADKSLKDLRLKSTELRNLVWQHGATADPKTLLIGLDMMIELCVELEIITNRERLAAPRNLLENMNCAED